MSRAWLLVLLMIASPLAAQERAPTAADSARVRIASARSDLRNLVIAQEAYFMDNSRYAKTMEQLGQSFRPSTGNKIRFVVVEDNAWTGELTRDGLVGSCTIWIGISVDKRAKTAIAHLVGEDGEVACDPQPALTPATSPSQVPPSSVPR